MLSNLFFFLRPTGDLEEKIVFMVLALSSIIQSRAQLEYNIYIRI